MAESVIATILPGTNTLTNNTLLTVPDAIKFFKAHAMTLGDNEKGSNSVIITHAWVE